MDKKTQDIAYFISFCIEQYKNEKKMTGAEVMLRFDECGILDFLAMNYEVLHTQSRQWIMEEIDSFIEARKEEMP